MGLGRHSRPGVQCKRPKVAACLVGRRAKACRSQIPGYVGQGVGAPLGSPGVWPTSTTEPNGSLNM
jgi:hypothetical protein